MTLLVVAAALIAATPSKAAEEGHHPHHVAAAISIARHNGKNSAAVGLDYAYIFESGFALGVYYEDVRGDFDIQAIGVGFGKFFDNGWKFSTGPGIERKLKSDKNLFLWHVTGGYEWHQGRWSFGPQATIDFIQDASTTYYLGFGVGYGF